MNFFWFFDVSVQDLIVFFRCACSLPQQVFCWRYFCLIKHLWLQHLIHYCYICHTHKPKGSLHSFLFTVRLSNGFIRGCQSRRLQDFVCNTYGGEPTYLKVKSVTVMTNSNSDKILNATARSDLGCFAAEECRRTIHSKYIYK